MCSTTCTCRMYMCEYTRSCSWVISLQSNLFTLQSQYLACHTLLQTNQTCTHERVPLSPGDCTALQSSGFHCCLLRCHCILARRRYEWGRGHQHQGKTGRKGRGQGRRGESKSEEERTGPTSFLCQASDLQFRYKLPRSRPQLIYYDHAPVNNHWLADVKSH